MIAPSHLSVVVLIPCLNEESAVGQVIAEVRRELPRARVIVIDNGSDDKTGDVARAAGAEVLWEPRRGKAHAVLAGFDAADEDVAVMIDGDLSYPAAGAKRLVERYEAVPVDMITGLRCAINDAAPYRPLHRVGSAAFEKVFGLVFDHEPRDLFSGLRLFSRKFYRNVPILFRGFELETELTVQAIEKRFTLAEVEVPFRERAAGSSSKLRTVRDGFRILRLLFLLFRDYRPLAFFGSLALLFFMAGLAAGSLPIYEYITTRMVGRFPLAILAAALMNLSMFTLLTGVTLESSLRHRREAYQVSLRNFR